ncbi:MAG TPA: glycoside hydrolase family 13 protein [Candidatus Nanopelagicales bacterium]
MPITNDADWWRNAVIYQIYPKSWADADGDGFGDIAGIRAHLAHLARLGVDAVWCSPWYRSPQADGGYDVSDFRAIDPLFGDVPAAEALVDEAHDLGLKVIVDIVPNHTSSEHRFFQEALASEPGSAAWQRYHCLPGREGGALPPNDWASVFGGRAWDPIPGPDGQPSGWWYLHLFDATQPDLNWEHPDVHAEFVETLRFWFDRGVDGFRIDVAMGLVKAAGYPDRRPGASEPGEFDAVLVEPMWDQPGVHEIWREWRRVANAYTPPRAFVGEVWVSTAHAHAAYLRPDELHTAFNFHHLKAPWDGPVLRRVVDHSLYEAGLVGAPTTWVLENHDVPRVRTRYALEAAGAVLPRSNTAPMPDLEPDDARGLARARAGLVFMLGLPGSAYLYQGQELALPEVVDLPAGVRQDPAFHRTAGAEGFRDGCRVPMPWTREAPSFGFSPTGASWLPMPGDWGELSVEAQQDDPGSMLELTRRALRLRRTEQALGDGDLHWLSAPDATCLVLRRPADDADPHVLVTMNLSDQPAVVVAESVVLSSGADLAPSPDGTGFVLPPDTAAWLR